MSSCRVQGILGYGESGIIRRLVRSIQTVHDLHMLKYDNSNSLEAFLKKVRQLFKFQSAFEQHFKPSVLTFIVLPFSLQLKNGGKFRVKYE